MGDAVRHPNIEVMTYAEVQNVDGHVGNFQVKIQRKPRYVNADKCTGCGDCVSPCPVHVPNTFDLGLSQRRAIYVPFGQSVPLVYIIDMDRCIKCYKCVEACGAHEAIDFAQEPVQAQLEVGTIVVATGFQVYDPSPIKQYGYHKYLNVLNTPELERLVDPSGPTTGKLYRPSDRQVPARVAFIQCVGSRNEKIWEHCSGFCCMYTIKNAVLLKDTYPEMDITIYYMDIRTFGKGYEEFYRRARQMGIKFHQGLPAEIMEKPQTNALVVYAEDLRLGQVRATEFDLVVLSPAAISQSGPDVLGRSVILPQDKNGFFTELHPKLSPVDSPVDGIFYAGSAAGPKDIPQSVAQGSAAAARAARLLSAGTWQIEPLVAFVDPQRCLNLNAACGICAQKCPYNAVEVSKNQAAHIITAKCHGCGVCVADCPSSTIEQYHYNDRQILTQIHQLLKVEPESKILSFMCHWCSYAGADTAGASKLKYPASSRGIKVMCSGRIDKDFVLEGFRRGAGIVLVSGCHEQDCHYLTGQRNCVTRFAKMRKYLEKVGISPERFQTEWISAAEGEKYARVMTELDQRMRSIGSDRIKAENTTAKPHLDKVLRHLPEIREEQRVPLGAI